MREKMYMKVSQINGEKLTLCEEGPKNRTILKIVPS
jgi:hypothetical protein